MPTHLDVEHTRVCVLCICMYTYVSTNPSWRRAHRVLDNLQSSLQAEPIMLHFLFFTHTHTHTHTQTHTHTNTHTLTYPFCYVCVVCTYIHIHIHAHTLFVFRDNWHRLKRTWLLLQHTTRESYDTHVSSSSDNWLKRTWLLLQHTTATLYCNTLPEKTRQMLQHQHSH